MCCTCMWFILELLWLLCVINIVIILQWHHNFYISYFCRSTIMASSALIQAFLIFILLPFPCLLMYLLHTGLMLIQHQMMGEQYIIERPQTVHFLTEPQWTYKMLLHQHFLLHICSLWHGILLDIFQLLHMVLSRLTRYWSIRGIL